MKPRHTIPPRTLAGSLVIGLFWAIILFAGYGVAHAANPQFAWSPVPITCSQMDGAPWWAWGVYRPDHTIEVRQYLCNAEFQSLSNGVVTEETGQFVGIIGHELAHSAGITDEHQADCIGWLIYPSIAHDLGFTEAEITAMRPAVQGAFAWGCS